MAHIDYVKKLGVGLAQLAADQANPSFQRAADQTAYLLARMLEAAPDCSRVLLQSLRLPPRLTIVSRADRLGCRATFRLLIALSYWLPIPVQ